MNNQQLQFLKSDFIYHLKCLAPDAKGYWGQMNGQQMVEHFSSSVRRANGRDPAASMNKGEKLKQLYSLMMCDTTLYENIVNPITEESPAPSRNHTMIHAIEELKRELNYFFSVYESAPGQRNPNFGDLNFEEQVQLLYKRAVHHLKQFGLLPEG